MFKKTPILLVLDLFLINICIISVFSVRFAGSVPARNLAAFENTWYYITAVFAILLYINGLYDFDETDDGVAIFFKVFSVTGLGAICIMALTFFIRAFAFPRTVILLSYCLMLLLMSVWRLFIHKRFLEDLPARSVALFGDPARFEHLKRYLKKSARKYEYKGGIQAGNDAELNSLIERGEVDCLLITDNVPSAQEKSFELFLKYQNMIIFLMPKPSSVISGVKHHIVIGDVPLVVFSRKTILGRLFLLKRLIDITLSLVALVPAVPIFILVAAAVKLTSRGPVFYTQPRVGRNGHIFNIIKFRTMKQNAEEETGPTLSSADDPRVTPVGKLLRRFKIDEAPQLINVLKGEMSIVGPRPERPVFVEEFERTYPGYTERKKVLPGLTGLAQVNGLYESDPSIKLLYDLLYIYNFHPLLDIAIMYRTIQFVMRDNL